MRIVKEFSQRGWKITIFQYNGKYSLQVEDGQLQQRYKLSAIQNSSDLDQVPTKLADSNNQKMIHEVFVAMNKSLPLFAPEKSEIKEDEFDDII